MKIHYRQPTLLEQMTDAIRDSKRPIDYFELTTEELNSHYSNFDRTAGSGSVVTYSYKGIPIKVKQ
jgi:hypothetical protein